MQPFSMEKMSVVERNPSDVVANVLECEFLVNEFELQSRDYIHFKTNPFERHEPHYIPH